MGEPGNDFNLDNLERMSEEGNAYFDNEVELDEIQAETMAQINDSLPTQNALPKFWKTYALLAVAAILFALLFFVFSKDNITYQNLYASNYETPPFLLDQMERGINSQDVDITKVKNLYARKEFEKCISLMESKDGSILKQYPDLTLFQGICLLENGNTHEAINILSIPTKSFEDVRHWYLALAQLSIGNKDQSIKSLNYLLTIAKTYKNTAAKELIKSLEK